MSVSASIEAVILRTTRYGEADLIANVHALEHGIRGVIAKGARRTKSRLGARLDPFLAVKIELIEGRGDLAIVRNVEVLEAHESLRASWQAQQVAAKAFKLVRSLSIEHQANDPMHHLLRSFLRVLDEAAESGALSDERIATALELSFALKLIYVSGIGTQLGACVRCGDTTGITSYSAADGGVVCVSCRISEDAAISVAVQEIARELLQRALKNVSAFASEAAVSQSNLNTLRKVIINPTLRAHIEFS